MTNPVLKMVRVWVTKINVCIYVWSCAEQFSNCIWRRRTHTNHVVYENQSHGYRSMSFEFTVWPPCWSRYLEHFTLTSCESKWTQVALGMSVCESNTLNWSMINSSSTQEFGFINRVDNVNWPPYRDSKRTHTNHDCGQFTLSAPLIKPNSCVLLPRRRSTTVSLETTPLILVVVYFNTLHKMSFSHITGSNAKPNDAAWPLLITGLHQRKVHS